MNSLQKLLTEILEPFTPLAQRKKTTGKSQAPIVFKIEEELYRYGNEGEFGNGNVNFCDHGLMYFTYKKNGRELEVRIESLLDELELNEPIITCLFCSSKEIEKGKECENHVASSEPNYISMIIDDEPDDINISECFEALDVFKLPEMKLWENTLDEVIFKKDTPCCSPIVGVPLSNCLYPNREKVKRDKPLSRVASALQLFPGSCDNRNPLKQQPSVKHTKSKRHCKSAESRKKHDDIPYMLNHAFGIQRRQRKSKTITVEVVLYIQAIPYCKRQRDRGLIAELSTSLIRALVAPNNLVEVKWIPNLQHRIRKWRDDVNTTVKFPCQNEFDSYGAVLLFTPDASTYLRHCDSTFLCNISYILQLPLCRILFLEGKIPLEDKDETERRYL